MRDYQKQSLKKPRNLRLNEAGQERRKYRIHYGILPSSELSKTVVVGNPGYGEPIGKYGSRPVQQDRETSFFKELEASVLKEGFRNPILCQSIEEGTFSQYGTTRLWVAQKHDLPIPCIIADTVNRWGHLEELHNEAEVISKFTNPPERLIMTSEELYFDHCP